jgi:hypothetical protein
MATRPDAGHEPGARAHRQQRRIHLRLHRLILDEDDVRLEREQLARMSRSSDVASPRVRAMIAV